MHIIRACNIVGSIIMSNKSLKYLSLQGCVINNCGSRHIIEATAKSNIMDSLNLSCNFVTDDFLRYLSISFHSEPSKKMLYLDLIENEFTNKGLNAYMEVIPQVLLIRFSNVRVDSSVIAKMRKIVENSDVIGVFMVTTHKCSAMYGLKVCVSSMEACSKYIFDKNRFVLRRNKRYRG